MKSRYRWIAIWLIAAASAPAAAAELTTHLDLTYGQGGNVELKLDLYRPNEGPEKLPGLLVIHGGAWRGGNKESMRPIAAQFAAAGYVAATVQYRLCPQHPFPAAVEDVKCAVRWMRAHAGRYGIRADRIGAMGASAGGHLALLLGMMDPKDGLEGDGGHPDQSSKVQAVVNYFGPTDLTLSDWDPRHYHLLIDFLGGRLGEQRERYRRASPITYLDGRDAPVITFHGTHDPLVPYGQAILLDHLLRQKKVPAHLEAMIGAGHGWLGLELIRTQKLAIDFLDRHLKQPET